MHKKIVINTGPVLALVAGLGNLDVLSKLYDEVYVTKEVAIEFHSLSKTFSMTGWRLGFACGNRDLI